MKRRLTMFIACLLMSISCVLAQTKIMGTVVSQEDGQPIIGAAVTFNGTTQGVATDVDGRFSLTLPQGKTLITVSYLGMESQTLTANNGMRIALKSDTKLIDEVVVVAYGTASRQSITGAVASVDAKKLEMRPVTSAASALEGAVPGIQVNNTYGEPGSDEMNIRIRGFGSVNGTNAPLIVVDGTPYGGSLNDINPQDIESISVLKDASSAALYGNKAANGVVLVTTKKGKSKKLNVRLNVKQGTYSRGLPEYEKLGIGDFMEVMRSGYQSYFEKDKGYDAVQALEASLKLNDEIVMSPIFGSSDIFDSTGKYIGKVNSGYTDLDWMDAVERTGYRQEYGASADAAGEKFDMFSSFGYLNEKGYVVGADYDRFTGRLRANFQPVEWFKTGLTVSGTMSETDYLANASATYYANPFYTAGTKAPVYPYYKHNDDGSIEMENGSPVYDTDNTKYLSSRNIVYELKNDINQKKKTSLNGQVYGTAYFLKDFAATIKGDLYTYNNKTKRYNNPVCGDGSANNGRLSSADTKVNEYRFSQELTWNHDFDLHHVDVLVGHESFKHTLEYDYAMKIDMKVSGIYEMSNFSTMSSINGYSDEYTTESYLSRIRYNFDEKYFADASFRRDGSSRFSHKWGNFWSLGASWMISKEKFMEDAKWVDYLKFRASYGEVGNDAGVDYYAYKSLFYSDTNSGIAAYYKTQFPNNNLTWEKSASLDIAIEGRLFDRFNFSIDFFNKTSKDLLFKVYNPLSAGSNDWNSYFSDTPTGKSFYYANIGNVRNRGVEIAMDVDAVKTKDWKWNIGLNMTTLSNKVTKLPGGNDILNGVKNISEGHSIYEFYTYTYAGVDQMNGRALYVADPELAERTVESLTKKGNYVTINGKNYVYSTSYAAKEWQGTALPDLYGSISTSLSWKNVTLTVLGTYSIGGKVYDSNYRNLMYNTTSLISALHKDVLNAWTSAPEGMTEDSPNRIDPNGTPQFDLSSLATTSYAESSRWLVNASYFVIKNINLNYTFPSSLVSKIGLTGLNIYGSVENAATFTKRKGMNPQYSFTGMQDNTYVTARVFTVGINMNF